MLGKISEELRRRAPNHIDAFAIKADQATSFRKTENCRQLITTDSDLNDAKLDKREREQLKSSSDLIHNHLPNQKMSFTECTKATNFNSTSTTKRSLSESSADEYDKYNNGCMWRDVSVIKSAACEQQRQRKDRTDDEKNAASLPNKQPIAISDIIDIGLRIGFVLLFVKLERMEAFKRRIHTEELWLYNNPRTPDYVSAISLLITVVVAPFCVTLVHLILTGDRRDFRAASWAWTLALCFNGLATSSLKLTVGRPRPDFFYRCFPDGHVILKNVSDPLLSGTFDMFNCTGSLHDINEGRKSFPSGHASFAFNSFGFICIYVGAKIHAFTARGRGQTWRLCIVLSPLYLATLIAVSRTCDYHHHWQDVVVGSLIGFTTAYFAYRQYYPSIFARNCHRAFMRLCNANDYGACENFCKSGGQCEKNGFIVNTQECRPLISDDELTGR